MHSDDVYTAKNTSLRLFDTRVAISRLSGNDSTTVDVDTLSTDEATVLTGEEHIRGTQLGRLALGCQT